MVRQNTRGTGRKTFRIKEEVALYTDLQLHSITISRSFSGSRKWALGRQEEGEGEEERPWRFRS